MLCPLTPKLVVRNGTQSPQRTTKNTTLWPLWFAVPFVFLYLFLLRSQPQGFYIPIIHLAILKAAVD